MSNVYDGQDDQAMRTNFIFVFSGVEHLLQEVLVVLTGHVNRC